ncbi:MAG: cobalamin biosynthesis protein CobQ [Paracoccaceae bacterium]
MIVRPMDTPMTPCQGIASMNTPAHLIFGLAAFGRPHRPAVTCAALIGALLPDLSLYALAGWHLQVIGTSPEIVFRELYYSEAWQSIFRIDNSFVIWGLLLALAAWRRSAWAIALTGAALLHLALDFPLHNDDARAHFWPLTEWVFVSPVSYWDTAHHGAAVAVVEVAACLAATALVWRRLRHWGWRALASVLLTLQLATGGIWMFMVF